jgi:hypothetical protein
MNAVTIYDPNNSGNYIRLLIEKSFLENHCEISIRLQNDFKEFVSEKRTIHFCQVIKIANWYRDMPTGSETKHSDLEIPELNLKFTNYYFEKGEGVYYLIYGSNQGELFKFQFWEQLGNSNTFISDQLMQCLENCK